MSTENNDSNSTSKQQQRRQGSQNEERREREREIEQELIDRERVRSKSVKEFAKIGRNMTKSNLKEGRKEIE